MSITADKQRETHIHPTGLRINDSEIQENAELSPNLQLILECKGETRDLDKRYRAYPPHEFISKELFPEFWATPPVSRWDENFYIREIQLGDESKKGQYADLLVGGLIDKITWLASKEYLRYIEASSVLDFDDIINFAVKIAFDLALEPNRFDYENFNSFSAYLMNTLRNKLHTYTADNAILTRIPGDALKRRKIEVTSITNPEAVRLHSKMVNPEIAVMNNELLEKLPPALERLKVLHPIYYDIIFKIFFNNMDLSDIAEEYGQKKQNIHVKSKSALKLLYQIINTPQTISPTN